MCGSYGQEDWTEEHSVYCTLCTLYSVHSTAEQPRQHRVETMDREIGQCTVCTLYSVHSSAEQLRQCVEATDRKIGAKRGNSGEGKPAHTCLLAQTHMAGGLWVNKTSKTIVDARHIADNKGFLGEACPYLLACLDACGGL